MDNMLKDLKEMEIKNLFNFYQLQNHLVEKQGLNYTAFLIEII